MDWVETLPTPMASSSQLGHFPGRRIDEVAKIVWGRSETPHPPQISGHSDAQDFIPRRSAFVEATKIWPFKPIAVGGFVIRQLGSPVRLFERTFPQCQSSSIEVILDVDRTAYAGSGMRELPGSHQPAGRQFRDRGGERSHGLGSTTFEGALHHTRGLWQWPKRPRHR